MTVAIAALSDFGNAPLIIAAEDHMITAGDVEFEQPQPKIWRLSQTVLAMMYGSVEAQSEIANTTEGTASAIPDVAGIAVAYARHQADYIRRQAEATVLAPLGLTSETFLQRQATLHPRLVSEVATQLKDHYYSSGLCNEMGGALIIGADASGVHIYQVEHGRHSYMNSVGFVAAGSGQWHAESQFMFSKYTKQMELPDVLSILFAAKKRAEVAPGVGRETDVVFVTAIPPNVVIFKSNTLFLGRLEAIYERSRLRHEEIQEAQNADVRSFLNEFLTPVASAAPSAPAPQSGELGPAPDETEPESVVPEQGNDVGNAPEPIGDAGSHRGRDAE